MVIKSNILLDKLPNVTPSGLKIRTDFRETIKFEMLMQDKKIDQKDKVRLILELYYYDLSKIKDIKQAVEDILWFYRAGKEIQNKDEDEEDKEEIEETETNNIKQIYSYEFDAEYIYSAFMEQYKIDLNTIKYLHWWKFKALFNSLNEDVLFSKIMGYRSINLAKIQNKEMHKFYKKMKEIYALPDMRSEEEKEEDFANELW